MEGNMKAMVLTKPGHIEMESRRIPEPGPYEVLIKVGHVGICGSDLHYYEYGRIGNQVVKYPMVLGHECSGEVMDTGKDVKGIQKGDIVAVEPQYTCGKCEFCKTGRYNLCPDVFFMATPPNDGAFCEYIVHPYDMVYKLPENMGTMEGALVEPLAIGFNIARQAGARIGDCVHICGAGCIGLVTAMALKAMGITDISISDVIEGRLEFAGRIGAKTCIHAAKENVTERINQATNPAGIDIVVEASGNTAAIEQTVDMVKRGGTIILVGYSRGDAAVCDFNKLILKEARIETSRRYKNVYPAAIKAVSEGLIPVKELVTHMFPFKDTAKAMEYAMNNKNEVIKAVIEF